MLNLDFFASSIISSGIPVPPCRVIGKPIFLTRNLPGPGPDHGFFAYTIRGHCLDLEPGYLFLCWIQNIVLPQTGFMF